jgi:hypothetical protein
MNNYGKAMFRHSQFIPKLWKNDTAQPLLTDGTGDEAEVYSIFVK